MIPYILHAAILLAGCLAFYKLLLQRETFFRLNRWVLIACIALAFVLPLARVPQQWSLRSAPELVLPAPLIPGVSDNAIATGQEDRSSTDAAVVATQPVSASPAATAKTEPQAPWLDASRMLRWAFWLYWFGVLAFGINLLVQAILLLYRAFTSPVIRDGPFRIIELKGKVAPCSFGPYIFINPEQYEWDTYNQVLEHEKIHCREGHTWDILLAELVLVFQWFNPFAWAYRKTLENNLEFLTDARLLDRTQVDPASYQMSLLRVSAPHLPLGLTTNYNQSLLKKRVLMMHSKRSNIHTAWKYFFLLPLLALFMCLLNEPSAQAQQTSNRNERKHRSPDTEGYWFATIKNDRIQFNFQDDDNPDSHNMNGNSFALSEFPNLPRGANGNFTLTRDAGTMQFTGKFDGDQGMGHYKFVADPAYASFLQKEGIEPGTESDRMVLFFVNASKAYVTGLKKMGYTDISRNDLIPLAALHIDETYIQSLRDAGFASISLHNLIPFKSLGIDRAYIEDIRKVYPRVSASQLISFKAQGIDSKYVAAVRTSSGRPAVDTTADPDDDAVMERKRNEKRKERARERSDNRDVNTNVNTNINTNVHVNTNDSTHEEISTLISMKALGVDEAYIQSIRGAGLPNITLKNIIGFKALGVTAAYINSLRGSFPDLRASDISGAKANSVTVEFAKSFEGVGFTNLRLHDLIAMKATGVTPALVKEYRDLGFTDIRPTDVIGAKSVGATPEFIREMKSKGYVFKTLGKATGTKATVD
jgi:hypothetical protein